MNPFSRSLIAVLILGVVIGTLYGQPDAKPKKFALLVGVKDYEHSKLAGLNYPEADATVMAQLLKSHGYNVVLLCDSAGKASADSKPTRTNILKQLDRMLDQCKKEDTVLVGLAGHGVQFEVDRSSYFCPVDAHPLKPETLVSLKLLYQKLDDSGAGVKLLLVDACRDDPLGGRGRGIDGDTAPKPPKGVAALFSCSGGERAFEHDKLRHGVFFHYVIEGLKGKAENADKEVTWDSLRAYVKKQVSREVPLLMGGGAKQHPNEVGNLSGEPPVLVGGQVAAAAKPDGEWEEFIKVSMTIGHTRLFLEKHAQGRLDEWRRKAEAGDSNCQVFLAKCYQSGIRQTKDFAEATKWYRKSADQGNTYAMSQLGWMHFDGRGVSRDYEEALKWFRKSAELRCPEGVIGLGYLFHKGKGVARDYDEAMKYYKQAVELGHAEGLAYLGDLYLYGEGVAKDYSEASKWYRKGVEVGNASSMWLIGDMYRQGLGFGKDSTIAMQWYMKAANLGDADAMGRIAHMYVDGNGVSKDYEEALRWLRKAVEQDNAFAMFDLGSMYEQGLGVPKNTDEALKWYSKAVEQRHSMAANNIGMMCYDAKDYEKAMRWFRTALEFDDKNGMALQNIAVLYDDGLGVTQNSDEAIRLWRQAAGLGNKLAIAALRKRGIEP